MEVKGKIKNISEKETYGNNSSVTAEIETLGDYPTTLGVKFWNDKMPLLDSYKVNDEVKIGINIKGKKWTNPKTSKDQFFHELSAWRIDSNQEVTNGEQNGDRDLEDLAF